MKRILLAALLLCLSVIITAQGLRHSVCIVAPEYTSEEYALFDNYSLYVARAGMKSASRALVSYKNENTFGSGVVIEYNGKKLVLTNLHVVGYAQTATITFQLHSKTIRYTNCPVITVYNSSDLAAIVLPDECEMVALPFYTNDLTEDISIVAAGFPELADKPSWQMTRGIISNARLQVIENAPSSHIIQHSAQIDPGSSGGPLLIKEEDGKYHIVGINTWKAFYREGVGLAIGGEDINAFLNQTNDVKNKYIADIEMLKKTTGEDWLYMFEQLPDSVQEDLRKLDWKLPLEPVAKAVAIKDSLVAKANNSNNHYDRSAPHIAKEMGTLRHIRIVYDNYFSINQQVALEFGLDWGGYVGTGIRFATLIKNAQEKNYEDIFISETQHGYTFGLYLGGQIPIAIGKHIIAPRITQSAAVGPVKTHDDWFDIELNILTDTRMGLDWHIPVKSAAIVLGAHYNMDWLWAKGMMQGEPLKSTSDGYNFNLYLQHGIGVTVGVAW